MESLILFIFVVGLRSVLDKTSNILLYALYRVLLRFGKTPRRKYASFSDVWAGNW